MIIEGHKQICIVSLSYPSLKKKGQKKAIKTMIAMTIKKKKFIFLVLCYLLTFSC